MPLSEVSQEEDEESILTKDERFMSVDSSWQTKCMFKPMKKGGVVQSVKSSRHISRAARIVTFPESIVSVWAELFLVNGTFDMPIEGWKLGEMERWGIF